MTLIQTVRNLRLRNLFQRRPLALGHQIQVLYKNINRIFSRQATLLTESYLSILREADP